MTYKANNTRVCYVPFTESGIPYFMVNIILNDDEMIPISYKWECGPLEPRSEFISSFYKAEEEAIKYAEKLQSKFDLFLKEFLEDSERLKEKL